MSSETKANPFTISEVGEPGSLRAVADFTCPKCSQHTRFTPFDQDDEGGFTCPHCQLLVKINGPRLSDYQLQLDAINNNLATFTDTVQRKLRLAASEITAETADELEREAEDESKPN